LLTNPSPYSNVENNFSHAQEIIQMYFWTRGKFRCKPTAGATGHRRPRGPHLARAGGHAGDPCENRAHC